MMSLEEYIAKRKKEDRLNERELNRRLENARICVNYVFEYFNNYLELSPADERTMLKDYKLSKYNAMLHNYKSSVRDWLVQLYSDHGKYLNRHLENILIDYDYYLLFDSEAEFRSLSYDVYAKIVKKLPFMQGEAEMLYSFLKDYHRVTSSPERNEFPQVCNRVNSWIESTYKEYGVNIEAFCMGWAGVFYYRQDAWPATHKLKNKYYGKNMPSKNTVERQAYYPYGYDHKQKNNLFNLDSLYRNMPKKKYLKGRKQDFEIIIMYYWIHDICGDREYWHQYLDMVLPDFEKE